MRTLSLKWRMSLLVTALLMSVVVALSAVAYGEMQESQLRNIDRTLAAMANGILALMDDPSHEEPLDDEIRTIVNGTDRKRPGRYRVWLEGTESPLFLHDPPDSKYRRRWLSEVPFRSGPALGGSTFMNLGQRSREYRAMWVRRETFRGPVNVLIGVTSHDAFQEMREFRNLIFVLGGGLLLASAVAAALTVMWGLRPITTTAQQLRRVTLQNLGQDQLENVRRPRELKPFVSAVRDMLERLDLSFKRQKQFVADASHELRTPLTVIKSTLQAAVLGRGGSEGLREAIHEALDDVDRMARLLDQLLTLSRMDAEDQISTADIRLDLLLPEIASVFDAKASQTGGRVVVEPMSECTVRGNGPTLRCLFENLVDNAVKYGPAGGTVRVSMSADPDGRATVCVQDEGGRIPPDVLPHVFDRFYRADPSRSRETGGAGLGLAISLQIARRHRGDISIDSRPELGTRVMVELPLAEAGSSEESRSP